MNKEEFLKKLNKNLKKLSKKERKEELAKYANIDVNQLDPNIEANKIYEAHNIKEQISLLEAWSEIIKNIEKKDKRIISNLLLFCLYLFVLIIVIKIPFIYTRDMIYNLFNNYFEKETTYILWNLLFEALYAITTIIILIKLIKTKALELKKNAK